MGLVGYQSNVLKALGFLAFKCQEGLPGQDSGSITQNGTHTGGQAPPS